MALSADTSRNRRALHKAVRGSAAIKTSTTIYNGSLVSIVESTGRLTTSTTATGAAFVGVADFRGTEDALTGNTAGTVSAEYIFGHEELFTAATALTTTYRMCNVVAQDDDTVTTGSSVSSAKRQWVGMAVDFNSDGDAWVWVGHFGKKDAP